jgi:hypothetical protein
MIMTEQGATNWNELGVVSDDETGIAARVYVGTRGRVPVPLVQLGRLAADGNGFLPSVIPDVNWEDGKGKVGDLKESMSIPHALASKVHDMLKPHLVLPDPNELSEDDFKLVDAGNPAKLDANLLCGLRCS